MIAKKLLSSGNAMLRFNAAGLLPVLATLLLGVSSAQATTDVITASGTWTAPAGVTSVTVEAWGGGGGGGRATGNPAKGGGGAGGQYASSVVAVTPGNSYAVVVGTGGAGGAAGSNNGTAGGDSTFATNVVVAKGGAGGAGATANNSAGTAGTGSATGGVGTTVFAGGNGSSGIPAGGAGGGGAGSGGAGGNASGNTAGAGTAAGGGAGAAAMTADGACTNVATIAGGGGCGGYATGNNNRNGGNGAAGMVEITYAGPVTVTANPTQCVNDASIGVATGYWTGLGNVGTQNNVYAQASVANSDITNYLKCTGYGFNIPAGATITGITVRPWLNATFTMYDNAMQLVKGGAIQPTNLATGATIPNGRGTLAATPTQFTYGGSTNLWGNTWTAADINSTTFGAAFAAQRGGFASTQQAAVDAMPITIDYTLPSTPSVTSINLASTNPSSPATAVSWTVTFSTSVTGVAAGNFALVQAGGVSGATITSVSGSGTTWTVNANTGSGYGTLGLNMVNVTGISPAVTTTMPFVGQVYTIAAPLTCITDNFSSGTLDTSLWTVKTISGSFTPQVVNVGGGDYRLRLTDTNGNEATFAQLKPTFPGAGNKVVLTFDYFSYGGSGADGIAVTFSDASVSSTTGGFGGSLGYAQNTNGTPPDGFGGGWMGTGIDDYGNFPNTNEGRQNYPAGWTPPAGANTAAGFYPRNVSIRGSGGGTTGYYLIANTGTLASGVAPSSGAAGATPYRYRVTLDHSDSVHAYVTVEVDTTGTGNSYTTLIPKFDIKGTNSGQAAVPTNWLVSFTGSTGGSTNYHEFKQVQVCANSIIGSGPDHLEIDHPSGTGLTCTPSTLTIKACANPACTTAYTSGVTGALSATGTTTVNWSGGSGFSIPSGSSTVTKDVQVTTPGTTVFSTTSTPASATATTCNFGTPNCTFTSADSGFLVSAPNHVAESASTLTIQAVKKADNSLSCVPAFASTSKSVNLKCAYVNPATGTLPVRVGAGGTALNASGSTTAACDGTGANVTLNFDATGTATPALKYADVGQMSVSAAYTGTAGSLDAGLSMTGTGSFIVAPASFSFSGLTAGPIKAGNSFSATVTALNALGNTTPNFGKEALPGPAGVTLTSTLVSPVGGANPTPGNNVIPGSEFGAGGMVNDANGVATVNNLSWGEVGNISLLATLTNPYGYLGTLTTPTKDALGNLLIATGNSATVGAFIPDHFDTAVIATTTTPMPCPTGLSCPTLYNGFVYSGQPFSMQVIAKNQAGGTTSNYHSAYGLSNNVTLSAWDALGSVVTQNPGSGSLAINPMLSSAFNHGVGTTSTQAYTFATSPTAPTNIFLRAVDAVNTTVTSLRATPATSVEGGVKVVSGKVKVSNAHGSEMLNLPMNVSIQYYDGTFWQTSLTDSVTSLTLNLSNYQRTSGGAWTTTPSPASGQVVAGILQFILSAPTGGGTGSVDVSISAPPFLLTGSNGAGVDPNKPGRATFGVYKGSREFIYLREDY